MSPGENDKEDDGADALHWAKVASFKAPYEAELARQQLEAEDIPAIVQGDLTGIFGPGYMGPSPLGVAVLVPSDRLREARELIADFVEAFGGSPGEDDEEGSGGAA
jgi:hypothetical protein